MKATGMVRRIDDLGRVVIPKEIRRVLHIREGAPLEIFTNDQGDVIFRKYLPLGEFPETASQYVEALWRITRYPAFICDREHVISAAGPGTHDLVGRKISPELDRIMLGHKGEPGEPLIVRVSIDRPDTANVVALIVVESDAVGCVALAVPPESADAGAEADRKFAKIAAAFLGKQMGE